MIRRVLILAFTLTMVVLLGVPAGAAEGSILITNQGQRVWVYYLGRREATGFRLLDRYGGGYLTFDDTLSTDLAEWFSGKAEEEIPGVQQKDSILFAGLQEGLYLVRGEVDVFEPFMVTLPWDGFYWEVEVDPMNSTVPQTGDSVGVAMFAMAASGAGVAVLGRRRKKD